MITVGGCLELVRSFNSDPGFAHQATDAPVPDIDTDLLQFFGHPRAVVATQTQTRLFLDMPQKTISMRCMRLAGRLRKARNPRGLTFMT